MYSFGFIGCGNMGGTLADAVSKVEKNIALSDKSEQTLSAVAEKLGAPKTDNADIAANSKFIVLGVKPQILPALLTEIAPIIRKRKETPVIISMAAGVKIEKIESVLGELPVIRIMPNTPASVGEGIVVYSENEYVSDKDKKAFEKAFSKTGDIINISENLIDAASAVSGCGPAFVYMFIDALAGGGVKCGLSRELALRLASKTVLGAAKMVLSSDKHPEALKDAVCSPAGSTIEGVTALEDGSLKSDVIRAVSASYKRTLELG